MPWGFSQVDSKSSRHHISTSRCCRSAMRTLWARISRPHCDTPSTHDAFHEGVPPTRVYPIPSTHAPTDHCCFDGVACFHVLPSTAPPSTQERNDISADVILAKELKRPICRWHAFVKGIDSCSACHHAALISVPTRSA